MRRTPTKAAPQRAPRVAGTATAPPATSPPLPGVGLSAAAFADALLPVCLAAGHLQLQHFRRDVTVQTKADTTPVTIADQASERLILKALARIAAHVPVVAEEAMAAGARPEPAETFLLVDPLDGTREFISGRGEFTVNIALISKGRAVFGLVYAPVAGDLFVTTGPRVAMRATVPATSKAGCMADTNAVRIKTRKAVPGALVALVSRSHLTPATEAFMARFTIAGRRSAGSSLKFCLIAAGEADLYPRAGRTSEWDTAAGDAVLRAAGGSVTTFNGAPLRYGKAQAEYRNPDYVAWGAGFPAAVKRGTAKL